MAARHVDAGGHRGGVVLHLRIHEREAIDELAGQIVVARDAQDRHGRAHALDGRDRQPLHREGGAERLDQLGHALEIADGRAAVDVAADGPVPVRAAGRQIVDRLAIAGRGLAVARAPDVT